MKSKKILILILPVFLTACANPKVTQLDEKTINNNMNSYDSRGVDDEINAIRSGLTPKTKPTGKASSNDSQGTGQEGQPGEFKLENLAAEYSQATIKTNMGDFTVKFYKDESPVTVNVFLNLAKKGFYDGTKFHRVIKDFMIQGGDPLSKDDDPSNDGRGGPGFQFQDEINEHKLVKGSLAMANSGPNTNGSQFFIVTTDATPWLDGKHTNFGYVTKGLDIVEKIGNLETDQTDHPVKEVIVNKVELEK